MEFNRGWTPTIYADGGKDLYIGSSSTSMRNMIGSNSQRAVAPLDLIVKMEQVGGVGDTYDITVRIGNGVSANSTPAAPAVDAGPTEGEEGVEYFFESATTDPDADEVYYRWDWGDGRAISDWLGPYASGETCTAGYTYTEGDYDIKVQAKDAWGVETAWSAAHTVSIAIPQCCVVRGNVDHDAGNNIDISDLVYLVDYMFTGGPPPPCEASANVDGTCCVSGSEETLADIDISDLVYLVDYMFTGGPVPPTCAP